MISLGLCTGCTCPQDLATCTIQRANDSTSPVGIWADLHPVLVQPTSFIPGEAIGTRLSVCKAIQGTTPYISATRFPQHISRLCSQRGTLPSYEFHEPDQGAISNLQHTYSFFQSRACFGKLKGMTGTGHHMTPKQFTCSAVQCSTPLHWFGTTLSILLSNSLAPQV